MLKGKARIIQGGTKPLFFLENCNKISAPRVVIRKKVKTKFGEQFKIIQASNLLGFKEEIDR